MKKILLTGASGFLGSALALGLLSDGKKISLLIRQSSELTRLRGKETHFNICRFSSDADVKSILTRERPDIVIHTACLYGRTNETSLEIQDANVRFGLSILQGLIENNKPCTFINTGTALSPELSLYALTKRHFADLGREITLKNSLLQFLNVKLQHMYGPGDDISKFTTHVVHSCYHNRPVLNLTTGAQKRDFIYIDDVVSAYKVLCNQAEKLEPFYEIDVGSGASPTIRSFVETVHAITSSKTKLIFGALPYRVNEAMCCVADIERMVSLGWEPKYDLSEGLKKTIEMEFFQ